MTHSLFPPPPIAPFERLHVYDSLMMNADRWHQAHNYHRRRQNVHYQALNQPGIVCGLGVCLTEPPESTDARFRDRRWIEIQPGLAIDVEGNVIVVDAAIDRTFRIAVKPPTTGSLTVYVVVSYREPELSETHRHPETLTERFRFDQKTDPPAPHEIELCRIQLKPGTVELEEPTDVLLPQANQLDLRFRSQAQARPQAVVRLAQIESQDLNQQPPIENLAFLMQSVAALYPALQGLPVETIALNTAEPLSSCDVLYLTDSQAMGLNDDELDIVKSYLQTGGVLLVEAAFASTVPIAEVLAILTHDLETPLHEITAPLRTQPFLFAVLPTIGQPIQLWQGGGIVLVQGSLSAAWGISQPHLREEIRSAQELGINILHFAWKRRHLTQLSSRG